MKLLRFQKDLNLCYLNCDLDLEKNKFFIFSQSGKEEIDLEGYNFSVITFRKRKWLFLFLFVFFLVYSVYGFFYELVKSGFTLRFFVDFVIIVMSLFFCLLWFTFRNFVGILQIKKEVWGDNKIEKFTVCLENFEEIKRALLLKLREEQKKTEGGDNENEGGKGKDS